jgi:hypothetical protein
VAGIGDDELVAHTEHNKFILSRRRANAEFTGERSLARRKDARLCWIAPGAHMAALSRSSGATTR